MAVHWQIAKSLPLVWADSYGLLQVFLNLARNSQRAIENCPRKELTITASAEEDSVVIRFEDTGTGVPSPQQLFRPFQPGADGAGLGLYVSRALVAGHGGRLTLHSVAGEGTTAEIRLPVPAPVKASPVEASPVEASRVEDAGG